MISKRLVVLFLSLMVGACGGDRDRTSSEQAKANSLPGVYTGVFPCDGCPGIPTTLWLRSDGSFFIEQRYPEVDERPAMDAYNLGRWTWTAAEEAIVLKGAGPARRFQRSDRDTLLMQTASELEHSLIRDSAAGMFTATIRMTGMMRIQGTSASFSECLSGLVVPVAGGREFSKFLHQRRSAGTRGEATYVELDGRFSWASDGTLESLTIERFVTVRVDEGC